MIEEVPATPTEDGGPVSVIATGDQPVELLVQLAEDDEIDPWDIDIVAVTDAFLDKLDEVDLRVSGRALFYASVLLRMKSEVLVTFESEGDPEEEFLPDDHWEPPEDFGHDPIVELEAEMDRRLERKRARGTPETLDELIRDLRDIERRTWWKPHREYDTSTSPRGFSRGTQTIEYRADDDVRMADEPTESDVTGATHTEDVDDLIESVWEALAAHYEAGRAEVLFAEIATVAGSRARTFLGVLFLAHRGRIALEQDTLFGDLWLADPTAVAHI